MEQLQHNDSRIKEEGHRIHKLLGLSVSVRISVPYLLMAIAPTKRWLSSTVTEPFLRQYHGPGVLYHVRDCLLSKTQY